LMMDDPGVPGRWTIDDGRLKLHFGFLSKTFISLRSIFILSGKSSDSLQKLFKIRLKVVFGGACKQKRPANK
jgi:hypothetical protein